MYFIQCKYNYLICWFDHSLPFECCFMCFCFLFFLWFCSYLDNTIYYFRQKNYAFYSIFFTRSCYDWNAATKMEIYFKLYVRYISCKAQSKFSFTSWNKDERKNFLAHGQCKTSSIKNCEEKTQAFYMGELPHSAYS